MRTFTLFVFTVLTLLASAPARAQFKEGDQEGAKLGAAQVHKWQAGVIVKAVGGPCHGIVGYMPLPIEWPEQQVKVVAQDISPAAKVSYQTLEATVKVMVVRIAQIQDGEEVKALLTFEVRRNMQHAPADTKAFVLPVAKELDPALRKYLAVSPHIEIQNAKIRQAAKDVGANKTSAWERVEALYDWTREKVEYKTGQQPKGAAAALKDGDGGHDDMSALFIAVCRAAGIPARMVWVPEFSYAEFYLLDKKGEGHWIPCAPAGTRAFGEMLDTRPILEKGDNFRPPYNSREHQIYMKEYLTGTPSRNGGQPTVEFVRKLVD